MSQKCADSGIKYLSIGFKFIKQNAVFLLATFTMFTAPQRHLWKTDKSDEVSMLTCNAYCA